MFGINKTDSMTSRGTENQSADEDEGKEANLKEKSSGEEIIPILKNSSLLGEKKIAFLKDSWS